jgi:hypothetical protein
MEGRMIQWKWILVVVTPLWAMTPWTIPAIWQTMRFCVSYDNWELVPKLTYENSAKDFVLSFPRSTVHHG